VIIPKFHAVDCLNLAYTAAADTVTTALIDFVLAMLHAPEAQSRARQELDQVTGGTRLPTFEDRDALPYVKAVVKEVLRWEPVTPLGVPRASYKDDVSNHNQFIWFALNYECS
jgi:cytochrome P450